MEHLASNSRSEFRRLLADAVESQCRGQVRWRAAKQCGEADITLPILGGLTGSLNFWSDGLVTGRLETLCRLQPAARDQVRKILTRENVRNACVAWELIRRGCLAVRVKGILLRGSPAKQVALLQSEVFKRLEAVHRMTADWFVPPDHGARQHPGQEGPA